MKTSGKKSARASRPESKKSAGAPNVVWFKDIRKKDIPIAGGKGANLGEMINAFPIPNGFIVTVNAYVDFVSASGLREKINGIVARTDTDNTAKLDRDSEKIRQLVKSEPMPSSLKKEIAAFLAQLSGKKFAVRSSATAEDLAEASFAGQQDTYLNISKHGILKAVQDCWASLYTSRAIVYRKNNRVGNDIGIAVVVQEMVEPDYAGVCFTVDPIKKKDILIETVKGLGEKLVSGEVTPNTYFVDRKNFGITSEHIVFPMDRKLIAKVAKLALKIQKHYKKPMDIEFAIKSGKVFILQARPITTL